MSDYTKYQFEISLSVLNHLGRNLYRNFITVLGEAISNSWDANAKAVHINIDRENNSFVVKDDGDGMNSDFFQNRFLKVGYSKRKEGGMTSSTGRPYIGAKGIGKLALLSCAETVSVISKQSDTEYVGGVINSSELDDAIQDDLIPSEYALGDWQIEKFSDYIDGHSKGTIILFENLKEDIRNTVKHLRKLIALNFRFALLDKEFSIFVNDEKVTLKDIEDLSKSTQLLWNINELSDPYLGALSNLAATEIELKSDLEIDAFIASVTKPSKLKITGTDERVRVDLFVNGRLRERDILKHIPTNRVPESYLYGQIHYNSLDGDGVDRFTSSREGIVASDENYQALLNELKDNLIPKIMDDWDRIRLELNEDGDDENPRKNPKARRAISLYNLSSKDYSGVTHSNLDDRVERWIKQLRPEAEFNIPAYVDCFLSENLVRKFIHEESADVSPAQKEIAKWKAAEATAKDKANISIEIRQNADDISYLGMDGLAKIVEGIGSDQRYASLKRDAIEYAPMRNAVGHTGLLSINAKHRLHSVYENIKARLRTLLA